jgi:hypothetical protein
MGLILGAQKISVASSSYYAIGVPHPQDSGDWSGNYDPLTVTHTVPSNWPSAESVGDYFVDPSHGSATDTDNTFGSPAKPRVTPPDVTLGAGNVYAFGNNSGSADLTPIGGDSFITITANGTAANPCFVIGDYDGTRVRLNTADGDAGIQMASGSSHCIVEGFETFNGRTVFRHNGVAATYITVRDWLVDGNNANTGGAGTAMFFAGAVGGLTDHCIFYNNTVRNLNGPFRDDSPTDFNGMVVTWNCSNIWIIGNTGRQCDGDVCRIGDNHSNEGSNAQLTKCYIAKNDWSRCGENPLDVKQCDRAVISENDFYDAIPSTSNDPGALVPVHEDAEKIYFIANNFREAVVGINCTTSGSFGCRNVYSIANHYYDIYADFVGDQTPSASNDVGKCFNNRSTQAEFWCINDTFEGYDVGAAASSSNAELNVVGCLFASKRSVESFAYDIMWNGSGTGDELDYNFHDSVDIYINGSVYTSLASLPGTFGDNSVTGTPDFTDQTNHDFTLGASSGALAVGINAAAKAVYDQFFTDFGFELLGSTDYPDKGSNARPAAIADWDAGANERA